MLNDEGAGADAIAEINQQSVIHGSIHCLRPGKLLNDEVVNFEMTLLN